MRSVSGLGRIAALGAVIAAVVLFALVLFGGSGGYKVTAQFLNAGQLVKGNPVQVDGIPVGSVENIEISSNGQAEITLSIKDSHAPLRRGTRAVIKQASLSGIANRYVELRLSDTATRDEIPDGGQIGVDQTTTAVDLDQIFNLFDPPTRVAVQEFFKGSARQYAGVGKEANRGFQFLNPALSTSSRLFNELTRDTPLLERFLIDSAKLVTAVEERHDDLAGLIGNLNVTTAALGNQQSALAESIGRLPPFMRRANTTFVNLRSTLDDVDPLVDASKPVAKKLQVFLPELRRFVANAEPTVRDLSLTIRRGGPNNDSIELVRSFVPLARIALDRGTVFVDPTRNPNQIPTNASGAAVRIPNADGAFEESIRALRASPDEIAFTRAYTKDFLGWFDDFSTTGAYDALGGFSRAILNISPTAILGGNQKQEQFKRCPGGADAQALDGSNVLSGDARSELDCNEDDRAVGPPGN